jgi:hypothetical protein
MEYEKEYRRIYEELTVEGGVLADGPNSDSFIINSACSLGIVNRAEGVIFYTTSLAQFICG